MGICSKLKIYNVIIYHCISQHIFLSSAWKVSDTKQVGWGDGNYDRGEMRKDVISSAIKWITITLNYILLFTF